MLHIIFLVLWGMMVLCILISLLSKIFRGVKLKKGFPYSKLEDTNWEIRLEAIHELKEEVIRAPNRSIVNYLIKVLEEDEDWHVRSEVVKILDDDLFSGRPNLIRSVILNPLHQSIVDALVKTLKDKHPTIRAGAARALRNVNAIRTIKPLLNALADPNENVRKSAAIALESACTVVKTVVFGSYRDKEALNQKHILYNPDVYKLTALMSRLEDIVIDTETCDLSQVEAFAKYLITNFDKSDLKESIEVRITGDPTVFSSDIYNVWNTCSYVDISIETVIFGVQQLTTHSPSKTLSNPEVSALTIPMSRLKQVIINTETYDFHQVEHFLTYAVNYIGQKHLKKHVEVHIYGDPKKLHLNIYNSFHNVCKRIITH